MSKTIFEQLTDGVMNAVGIGIKTEAAKIPVIPKNKGVILPKLSPIPTVKRGTNVNTFSSAEQNKIAQTQRNETSGLSKRITQLEDSKKSRTKNYIALKKQVNANKDSIAVQQKAIDKQKRWVAFMLKKWEAKNSKELSKMNSRLRAKLRREQSVYLKKLAEIRRQQRSVRPSNARPKKKIKLRRIKPKRLTTVRSGYRGKKSSTQGKDRLLRKRLMRLGNGVTSRLRQNRKKRRPLRKGLRKVFIRNKRGRRPIRKGLRRLRPDRIVSRLITRRRSKRGRRRRIFRR